MKLAGIIGTALLSLILAAPVYAQEQHDQEEQKDQKEQTAKPAQDEKKAETEKSAKQDEKSAQQEKSARSEEKSGQPENSKQEEKNAQEQHAQSAKNAGGNGGGRIPADRYKANFGREHTFRVTQGDFNNHRFQYGGYWFGFAAPWPSNWLYTQDVFVVDIGGVYYLCNPTYPGVNVALNITL
ncbi:MAG TPA: hypothetical protein VN950_19405 [Terriglobales bacterium]|nr:hypothetical protein [Terriglobales bacterium]